MVSKTKPQPNTRQCPSCEVHQNVEMFEQSILPEAMQYPHLHLSGNVCKACQLKHKACTKCGEVKPAVRQFWHKRKNGLYGLHSWCRVCLNEQNRLNHLGERRDNDLRNMRRRYERTKGG